MTDKEKLKIYEQFFDYLNPVSVTNEIVNVDCEHSLNDCLWTADIGGYIGKWANAIDAMESVLNQLKGGE